MPVVGRIHFRAVIVIFLTLQIVPTLTFSEDYSNWLNFMTIQVNTSESGVLIPDTVSDFPLLIRLTPETFPFFSQTQPGGADIRFAKTDGTPLSYHIEHWIDHSDDNDTAAIWVLMETLHGNDSAQNFTMFWGRSGAADSSDAKMVFRNGCGFIAAYHLDSTLTNATGDGFDGVDQGDEPTEIVNSIIGTGCFFGGNSFIQPRGLPARGVGTMSFWFSPAETFDDNSAVTQGIWSKTDGNATNSTISLRGEDYQGGGHGEVGQIQVKVESEHHGFYCNGTTAAFTEGNWYHVAMCWDGGATKLFLNGVLESTEMSSMTIGGESYDEIGRARYDSLNITDEMPRYFIGTLDEFRFEYNVRNESWIRLCYENQKLDQKLITFDLEGVPPVITAEPENVVAVVGKVVSFGVTAEGDGELSYKWLRYPSDSIGSGAELTIATVALADTGSGFRCVVESEFGIDSSSWITLAVIDTPRILLQPVEQNVDTGGRAVFTLEVKDTAQVIYSWRKVGGSEELSATRLFIIDEVMISDTGSYYCLIENPAAGVSSDTVTCSIGSSVSEKPTARYVISPKTGYAPLEVSFIDISQGKITSYHWDFGDSSYDTVMNPTHVYTGTGSYTVTLIVDGPGGSDTLIKKDSVAVFDSTISAVNSIAIDTAYYDPYSGDIILSWRIDSEIIEEKPQVGISYSYSPYNLTPVESDTFTMTSQSGNATVTPAQTHDTTCYIALWFRLPGGEWVEPTLQSMASVRLSARKHEIISYFDPEVERDTVNAFSAMVKIWKDSDYTKDERVSDTLELLRISTLPDGLVPVGPQIRFRNAVGTPPFFTGIHIDSIPAGYSIDNVRMYRFYDGVYQVIYETEIDAGNGFAYVKTDDLTCVFLPMIDTVPPEIRILGSTFDPITDSIVRHLDSVRISDNVANVQWRYYYGGNEYTESVSTGTTDTASTAFSVRVEDTIPVKDLLEGFRVMIVAYDGCGSDTLRFTRPVRFNRSEVLTTVPNIWKPVYATTVLDHPEADSLIARLKSINEIEDYNTRFFRLFRWCDYEGNEKKTDKWVEYRANDKKVESLFRMDPGKLIWLKTHSAVTVSLGEGSSLPVEDTFSVVLPPQQWTDFGLPYLFDVRIGEILSATGKNSDSVMVFKWKQENPKVPYSLEPVYVSAMPDHQDRTATIEHHSENGYSFYNTGSEPITLRIPPIPSYMSKMTRRKSGMISEMNNSGMWSAKCIMQTEDESNRTEVYFGYAPGEREEHFPPTPTFSKLRMTVIDEKTGKQFGHSISESVREGLVKKLLITNDGDASEVLTYQFEKTGVFPAAFSAYCYDENTGELTDQGTITVGSGSSASRWIVVGDASFRQQFVDNTVDRSFQLRSLYPNPFRSAVTIRYSVPFGADEQIRVRVFSTQGKMVWEKNTGGYAAQGENIIVWNGCNNKGLPVGSGLYIVQLVVAEKNGAVVKNFKRQVTLLR